MTDTITMNNKEVGRVSILERLNNKEIKQTRAAVLLGITPRQVRRLLHTYRRSGASGITHKLRGKPSNNRVDESIMSQAVAVVKTQYSDFTVALAHEKLVEKHQFPYSAERLRQALISDGFRHPIRQSHPVFHQMRERRSSEGELVQLDGSPHAWLEERGPHSTLLVFIDDATGKLLWLEMVKSESTNTYFLATQHYLQKHGKPLAFYTDKHGVFRVNVTAYLPSDTTINHGRTQFGRAMDELDIELIFANSPQAKGRVERMNQTLQDRLVKEMRLMGINTMTQANQYFPQFIEQYNQKFSVIPKSPINVHRPLSMSDNLDEILVQKHERVISRQLTLSYNHQLYQVDTKQSQFTKRNVKVVVYEDVQGQVTIHYKNQTLPYQVVARQTKSRATDTKQLNKVVDGIKKRTYHKPSPTHPWRRFQIT